MSYLKINKITGTKILTEVKQNTNRQLNEIMTTHKQNESIDKSRNCTKEPKRNSGAENIANKLKIL